MQENKMIEKINQWIRQGGWKNWKKSDWLILGLAGILILVIAFPIGSKKTAKKQTTNIEQTVSEEDEVKQSKDEYVSNLEGHLEDILSEMEGVGKVRVMITLSDEGEHVVEKDTTIQNNTTSETDRDGGNRVVTEGESGESTVYVEHGEEKYPYVAKEELPLVEGVMVVAEGAGNPTVVADISEAVESLFPVEPHKIKVVKMRMQEESN